MAQFESHCEYNEVSLFEICQSRRILCKRLQGNAEKSRIIMVGDTLKKSSDPSGGRLVEIRDFGDTE